MSVLFLCVCAFAGGVVPGDELMAVNGKILIDATLEEGQNSLARAWNSGGVWDHLEIRRHTLDLNNIHSLIEHMLYIQLRFLLCIDLITEI